MPLLIPDDLATRWVLEADGVFLIDHAGAQRQDARALRVLVVETDPGPGGTTDALLALVACSPIQVHATLTTLGDAATASRLLPVTPWSERWRNWDAVIIADRPEDASPGTRGPRWDELRDLLDWAQDNARCTLAIGWGAHALLTHRFQVETEGPAVAVHRLVPHQVLRRQSYVLRGIDDAFLVDVRWHRPLSQSYLLETPGLDVIAASTAGTPYVLRTQDRRTVLLLHHPLPRPSRTRAAGASHAAQLLQNWLNYYVYQPSSLATTALEQ